MSILRVLEERDQHFKRIDELARENEIMLAYASVEKRMVLQLQQRTSVLDRGIETEQ